MRVTPRHACRLPHEGRFLASTPDRSRLILAAGDGRFTALDGSLRVLHQGKLPVAAGRMAFHPRGDLVAIASASELVVASLSGRVLHRRAHRPWEDWEGGDVAFLGHDGSTLLAVIPVREAAHVALLRWESGEIVAEQAVTVPEPAGFHLVPHPAGGGWALWAGAGQDGQFTCWLRVEGGGISIEEASLLAGKEHGPVAFDPGGGEFVLEADGCLERYAHPETRFLGRIAPPEDEDFAFSETCCHLGGGRALVTNLVSSRLYLADLEGMTLGEEVVVEGHEPRPGGGGQPPRTDLWYLRGLPGAAVLGVHGTANGPQTVTLLAGTPLFG